MPNSFDDEFSKLEHRFNETSFEFSYHLAKWIVPSADFLFETELNAGVRTAALLKRQSKSTLEKIQANVKEGMQQFFDGHQYRLQFRYFGTLGKW